MFRFGFVHLQHSNVSKLITVYALHCKVYCAYTPSNGAMALLNKNFRIPYTPRLTPPLTPNLTPLLTRPLTPHLTPRRYNPVCAKPTRWTEYLVPL